jgi:hypothetical protein
VDARGGISQVRYAQPPGVLETVFDGVPHGA